MGNRACGGARIASKVFRFYSETDKGAALPSPKRLPSARLLEAGLRAGRHRVAPKTALARPPVIFPPLSEGLRGKRHWSLTTSLSTGRLKTFRNNYRALSGR